MPRRIALLAVLLTGCTPAPLVIREPAQVPEACLMPCEYAGPAEIRLNGDLLEAYRGRVDQVGCYETRLECVRQSTRQKQ